MARAVIRLGDYTSHGGRVIEATARMTIDGIPVALWGDHCSCPIDGHDNCVICEGEPNAVFDGRPVALEGHKTSCGASLIPSQLVRCNVSPLVQRVASGIPMGAVSKVVSGSQEERGNQHFLLIDEKTGDPLINMTYEITTPSGESVTGRTDDKGRTGLICGEIGEDTEIAVFGDIHED